MRKSFTLIELIVVIGIIALLSGLGVSSYNGFQQAARDTRRKEDLQTITNALNAYYAVNGRFPQAVNADTTCAYNTQCYVYSTDVSGSGEWLDALTSGGYLESLPIDPINNGSPPWATAATYYSYSYGNVFKDGQLYDLTTRLENTNDPDRCGVKNYKWRDANIPWCNGESSATGYPFGGSYTNQIYESSPTN